MIYLRMEVENLRVMRVEEITNLVGMDSYIASLSLDEKKLNKLSTHALSNGDMEINYEYETYRLRFVISRDMHIRSKNCGCARDRCGHIALGMKDIFTHFDELEFPEEKDTFQDVLLNTFKKVRTKKQKMNLEVSLKQVESKPITYELNLRIGIDKMYSLKKVLTPFIMNYQKPNYEISFGKYFTYDTEKFYFQNQDKKIIEFVKVYMEMRERSGMYSFYQTSPNLLLRGDMLKELLKLVSKKPFSLETNLQVFPLIQEETEPHIAFQINHLKDAFTIQFDEFELVPVTDDYEYFVYQDRFYHIDTNPALFLKTMIEHDRTKVTITKDRYKEFANHLYLTLLKLNPDFTKALETDFLNQTPTCKFYFEKKGKDMISFIKLQYGEHEINILSPRNYVDNTYIVRDLDKEQDYIEQLENYGFIANTKKGIFTIPDEEKACLFLQKGLKEIVSNYDTFVSSNLKNIRILKKTSVTNLFKIGTDGIMNYEFQIEGIDKSEIKKLLHEVEHKKKYYRMKSGDYLSLEGNDALKTFANLKDTLALSNEDLLKDEIAIPKYQSLKLSSLEENEYYHVDESIRSFIRNFEDYKEKPMTDSLKENKTLREYQKLGVHWMSMISDCEFGGILADEMGLGKSIQTITYMRERIRMDKHAKMLIVVPTSLLYNWEEEFQKFGNELDIVIVNEGKQHRIDVLEKHKDAQVFITSYGLLRQDLELYLPFTFDTVIIDEAQNIKNPKSETALAVKQIKSRVKFALTGTPIENSIYELWSIMDFIMPGYLGTLSMFKENYATKDLDDTESYLKLQKQISPFILRRKKKDVLKDLPEKLENKVFVELNEEQKKRYLLELERAKEEINGLVEKNEMEKNQFYVLALLTRLRQICIDPSLVFEDYHDGSSKFDTVLSILDEVIQNDHKVLLFSQFPSVLKKLEPLLKKQHISYYYLDGSTKATERMNLVHHFNADETNVFLISLKAGGTGLNLTSADVVIHLDPWWNPQVENQATDRTHRIGQKKKVEVVKLISKGTIEEKIIELQEKKKKLSDIVIEGKDRGELVLSKLTSREIMNLFDID